MTASFVGIDLAWASKNTTGVAALARDGDRLRVVASGVRRSDEEVVAFVAEHLAATTIVMMDAPLVVLNESGMRACDKLITRHFGARQAGAYPANRTILRRDRSRPAGRDNPPRGEELGHRLRDRLGFRWPPPDVRRVAARTGRFVFECYPHPAQVRLFGLVKTLKYKRKRQGMALARAEFGRYLDYLRRLRSPSLRLEPELVRALDVKQATGRKYKEIEDRLDAIFCAYLATLVPQGRMEGFGEPSEGCIVVPRAAGG